MVDATSFTKGTVAEDLSSMGQGQGYTTPPPSLLEDLVFLLSLLLVFLPVWFSVYLCSGDHTSVLGKHPLGC